MNYTIEFTDYTFNQIKEAISFISKDLGCPDIANKFKNLILDKINSLKMFPSRYALVNDEPWKSMGIRRMPIKNYIVYYKIIKDKYLIIIYGFIFNKMNQIESLNKIAF